jgi:hypothetical protein
MASIKRVGSAGDAAKAARNNPYLARLIEDDKLRESIRVAYESGRGAYARLNNGKAPSKVLFEDKKLHRELKETTNALRDVTQRLSTPPKRSRRGPGRLILLALVGSIAAVTLSEGVRSKLLDALFGKEEEFDYSATTAPATPAPEPVSA